MVKLEAFLLIFLLSLISPTLCEFTCGKKYVSGGLILGGVYSERGQWPWMAALYEKTSQKYFCGGSLISNSHVVTAAHCMQQKNNPIRLEARQVSVLLGKFDLSTNDESGSERRDVKKLIVHEDWNFNDVKYDADVAILVLNEDVIFSEYIAPVCLPTARVNAPIDGGIIVGWGKSDFSEFHETLPKHEDVKAVSNEFCFLNNYILAKISSNRTFCAGGKNVTPCSGDSGGGFFAKKGKTWILQGIISAAILNGRDCDTSNFAIYTNVNAFTLWIKNVINNQDSGSVQTIDLDNYFEYDTYDNVRRYACKVKSLGNTNENAKIKSLRGNHIESNSNSDVKSFLMHWERISTNLPNGIGEIFPNLEALQVEFCRLKFIHKSNFKNMEKLTILSLQANEITDFPYDTFWNMKNLRKIDLSRNNLIYLDPKLFQNNLKLEVFHAHFNSLQYLDGRLFNRNLNLKVLTFDYNKITVIGIDFEKFKLLSKINLRDNVCINLEFPVDAIEKLTEEIRKNCKEILELK